MNAKWLAIFTGVLLIAISAQAQYPYITQYTKNYFLINPAVAGLDSSSQLILWNRNNITTAKELQFSSAQLAYHTPVQDNQSGLGFKLSMDRPLYAYNRNISSFSANYAYSFPFTEETEIRVGMGLGVHRASREYQSNVSQGMLVDYLLFYDFGMLFNLDHWMIGVSAASANNPRTRNQGGPLYQPVSIGRVVTVMAKYNYDINELVTFMPSALLRNDGFGGDVSLEFKGEAELWNTFLVGIGYRLTRFGQLRINPPYGYPRIEYPDYLTIEVGGYFDDFMYFILSYDTPLNTNLTYSPSLFEGTIGIGL